MRRRTERQISNDRRRRKWREEQLHLLDVERRRVGDGGHDREISGVDGRRWRWRRIALIAFLALVAAGAAYVVAAAHHG